MHRHKVRLSVKVCLFFPLELKSRLYTGSDTRGNHDVDQHMLENAKSQSSWL